MHKSLTKIFAFLISFALTSSVYAALSGQEIQQINPPLNLTWNMNQADIEQKNWQLIPDANKQADTYDLKSTAGVSDQAVSYVAVFNKDGKLQILGMSIRLDPEQAQEQAQTVEDNLAKQYGKPNYISEGKSKSLGVYHYMNWGNYTDGYIAYTYYLTLNKIRVAYFSPNKDKQSETEPE